MSAEQQKKRNQKKIARLDIVAQLYKQGYSFRAIRAEVMTSLDLKTYSLETVHSDVQSLLAEWRKYRLENTDLLVQLELERIDDAIRELHEQWEKSKRDYTKRSNKRKGRPAASGDKADDPDNKDAAVKMKTYQREDTTTDVIMLGDVSYIAEIRKQQAERRKLLGLYAPEKRDISGDISFAALLMESGIVDDAEPTGHTKK
jgi:lambda repressor-like predicted transcriptional regulator